MALYHYYDYSCIIMQQLRLLLKYSPHLCKSDGIFDNDIRIEIDMTNYRNIYF